MSQSLKEVKIFIPEIPKEWTQRTRGGHTNIWNDQFFKNGLPEVRLDPPERGLYAERFDDGWYWVCGCNKCLGILGKYSYIVCYEHDRCETCGIHRSELKEAPWGMGSGWQCKPCHEAERATRKAEALAEARARGHSEDDCWRLDKVICPVCGSENSSEDMHESSEHEVECWVCDAEFLVEVEYEPKYTSRLKPESEVEFDEAQA
ncbi:hypothetical protein H7B90_00850 [Cohnella xylanilytica]|uniref:Uncharacterized protein n=1 Tax=Cohnella xylanilytica TaxID=557555 RepID=A0A841TVP2_9BACL|nr:hypothetical protein [Cohnella xylanilytica]MBB6689940.1 hypothetical protein [Cohnella xylanilytica]